MAHFNLNHVWLTMSSRDFWSCGTLMSTSFCSTTLAPQPISTSVAFQKLMMKCMKLKIRQMHRSIWYLQLMMLEAIKLGSLRTSTENMCLELVSTNPLRAS